MVDKALGWIRSLTEIGLALIALGVVLQIIFGAAVPFLGLRRPCRFSCRMGTMGNLL